MDDGLAGTNTATEMQLRTDMAAAHRLICRYGLNDGLYNHISLNLPGQPPRMMVTPNYLHWSRIRAREILVMDAEGRILAGEGVPNPSTWLIHQPVHEARADAVCLIHVHAPYSTALFMRAGVRLETRGSQEAAYFHGRIGYFDVYDGALTGRDEGERMAAALGDKDVLVLRNHGILVAGANVSQAVSRTIRFEQACRFQILAQPNGEPLNLIPEEVAAEMQRRAAARGGRRDAQGFSHDERNWTGWLKLLDETEPDYRD